MKTNIDACETDWAHFSWIGVSHDTRIIHDFMYLASTQTQPNETIGGIVCSDDARIGTGACDEWSFARS